VLKWRETSVALIVDHRTFSSDSRKNLHVFPAKWFLIPEGLIGEGSHYAPPSTNVEVKNASESSPCFSSSLLASCELANLMLLHHSSNHHRYCKPSLAAQINLIKEQLI